MQSFTLNGRQLLIYCSSKRLMQGLVLCVVVGFLLLTYFVSHGSNETASIEPEAKDSREVYHLTDGSGVDIRVMTFNIWLSGKQVKDGFQKIVQHILAVNPDVVCIQELSDAETFDKFLDALGDPWKGVFRGGSYYSDDGIFTRHKFYKNDSFSLTTSVGAKIELESGVIINVVGVHLAYQSYGPYAAQNKLVTEERQIMAGEITPESYNRVKNIKELIDFAKFQDWVYETDRIPLFVCGDFNVPSHRDWQENRKSEHGGWAFEWPATKLLENYTGLVDSFRVKYPDPVKNPAHTWSTVQKFQNDWNYTIPEPQDRLDFVFHKHPKLEVIDAVVYSGNVSLLPIPQHKENAYPSDHFAIIVDFKLKES
ncbi:Endonuclease exonuclease phosphatase domain containing protein [Aphelenchoides besseyi]|nr:Endonuclease exonuclease phosphatase domain containing protein [Aphelenchoides besseyi]